MTCKGRSYPPFLFLNAAKRGRGMLVSTRAVTISGLVAMLTMAPALAKAPPEEVAKLGKELTAIGAVRAGNAEGTIPEWTGGSNFTDAQRRLTPTDIEKMPGDELA